MEVYAVPRKHTQSSGECCQPQSVFVSKVRARQVGRRSFSKPKPKIFSPRNFKFQILKFDSNGSSLASNSLSNCTVSLYSSYRIPSLSEGCRAAWHSSVTGMMSLINPVASYPACPEAGEARLIRY